MELVYIVLRVYNHFGIPFSSFWYTFLSQDLVFTLQSMYSKKQVNKFTITCSTMVIAGLFLMTKK